MSATFPTPLHAAVADRVVAWFHDRPGVDAVLLVNSCARGVATPESDLDLAVLATALDADERHDLERRWASFAAADALIGEFRALGAFTGVHLDVIDGRYTPQTWDDGGGPDGFELEIGNQVAYSLPLWQRTEAFARLQTIWLPYYDEPLRRERLAMVRSACRHDLLSVPMYVRRGLYFQAFDRLYKAFGEFLQGLFIARRTYPLAYNKWIKQQIVEWLGLPDLYAQLPHVLEISRLESDELADRARALGALADAWLDT